MKRSSFSGTASDAVDAGRCRGNQEAVPFGRGFVMISSDIQWPCCWSDRLCIPMAEPATIPMVFRSSECSRWNAINWDPSFLDKPVVHWGFRLRDGWAYLRYHVMLKIGTYLLCCFTTNIYIYNYIHMYFILDITYIYNMLYNIIYI